MAWSNNGPKDIQSEVLAVLSRQESQRGATEIRVVDWIVNGKHYPQLEKREFFVDQEGEQKLGKAKGFSFKDLQLITDKWDEILEAFGKEAAPPPATATVSSSVSETSAEPAAAEQDF